MIDIGDPEYYLGVDTLARLRDSDERRASEEKDTKEPAQEKIPPDKFEDAVDALTDEELEKSQEDRDDDLLREEIKKSNAHRRQIQQSLLDWAHQNGDSEFRYGEDGNLVSNVHPGGVPAGDEGKTTGRYVGGDVMLLSASKPDREADKVTRKLHKHAGQGGNAKSYESGYEEEEQNIRRRKEEEQRRRDRELENLVDPNNDTARAVSETIDPWDLEYDREAYKENRISPELDPRNERPRVNEATVEEPVESKKVRYFGKGR